MLASTTEGADPRPFGINDLLLQPQNDSPYGSPWAPARDQSGCATDTVTCSTCEAEPCHVGGRFDLLDPCAHRNGFSHVFLCSLYMEMLWNIRRIDRPASSKPRPMVGVKGTYPKIIYFLYGLRSTADRQNLRPLIGELHSPLPTYLIGP